MLKKIIGIFTKSLPEEKPSIIELSKIDKHMNFILRKNLGVLNRIFNEKVTGMNSLKEDIIHDLRTLHKAELMNKDIHPREIQIMQGNRENYIKRISRLISEIDMPKNYLDAYDYCIHFSDKVESLYKDIQKNIFILQNFFDNEVKGINKKINQLESLFIDIRVGFEKNNISALKEIQDHIKDMSKNIMRIRRLEEEICKNKEEIQSYDDKISRLNERISTIKGGTDYKALESFKAEKQQYGDEFASISEEMAKSMSELSTALKKYFYKNQEKKILKSYLDNPTESLINDKNMEIIGILRDIKEMLEKEELELKDKKKEHALIHIANLNEEKLRKTQSELTKIYDQIRHTQSKITHNSAALNLSEQQYWISNTNERKKHHEDIISKLGYEISQIEFKNDSLKETISTSLKSIVGEKIVIEDDLRNELISCHNKL
jgi:predicted  nucleic acid-binding Zn-ribbon protein